MPRTIMLPYTDTNEVLLGVTGYVDSGITLVQEIQLSGSPASLYIFASTGFRGSDHSSLLGEDFQHTVLD